jgi:hypothetical protein
MPNLSEGAAGTQIEMYSFDHDLEEFVAIGLGTISEDGTEISSNVGVGVIKAGWHGAPPPPPPPIKRGRSSSSCSYNCPTCYFCDQRCNCKRDLKPVGVQDDGDCKTNICGGETIITSSDVPEENSTSIGDCKKPGCSGANPHMSLEIDDTDITEDDKKCATCSGGEKIEDPDKIGSECGDGSKEKECYTCKGGKCDNHCEAAPEKEIDENTLSLNSDLYEGWKFFQESMPFLQVTLSGSIGTKDEKGYKCCKDCSETTEPVPYLKSSVEGSANIKVGVLGGIGYALPKKKYGPVTLGGSFKLGPAAEASLALKASGTLEKAECDTECDEQSLSANGMIKLGVIAEIAGKVEACDALNENCTGLAAGLGSASTDFIVSASMEGKKFEGPTCTQANCRSYSIGKLEFQAVAKFEVSLLGIYKYSYSNEVTVPLAEASNGGNCG